eukprot:g11241.t1
MKNEAEYARQDKAHITHDDTTTQAWFSQAQVVGKDLEDLAVVFEDNEIVDVTRARKEPAATLVECRAAVTTAESEQAQNALVPALPSERVIYDPQVHFAHVLATAVPQEDWTATTRVAATDDDHGSKTPASALPAERTVGDQGRELPTGGVAGDGPAERLAGEQHTGESTETALMQMLASRRPAECDAGAEPGHAAPSPALPNGRVAGDPRDLAAPGLPQTEEASEAFDLNYSQEWKVPAAVLQEERAAEDQEVVHDAPPTALPDGHTVCDSQVSLTLASATHEDVAASDYPQVPEVPELATPKTRIVSDLQEPEKPAAAAEEEFAAAIHLQAEELHGATQIVACPDLFVSRRHTEEFIAAMVGNLPVVNALLDRGAETDLASDRGCTPLFIAAERGHLPVVNALLDRGAKTDLASDRGCTPLFIAAGRGHLPVVNALLDRGADTDLDSDRGCTPLLYAALGGHMPVVKALLHGRQDSLFRAWRGGHLPVGNTLLEGADKDATNDLGETLLRDASSNGHLPLVNALLDGGEDKNASSDRGYTPLFLAAGHGHLPVVNALLDRGADTDVVDDYGCTPLINAAQLEDNLPVVETLLEAGCNPIIHEKSKGYTALHFAAQFACVDHVSRLLRWGADEGALDKDGKAPADLIDDSAPQAEHVRRLLARAPADRAWRRRGWLAMLRSRTLKSGGSGGSGRSSSDAGARSVKQRGGSGGKKERFDLVSAVAWLRGVDDGVFRNVVGFL